eukprot:TRINITY_DN10985_c0_g1_i1.p1 TRINITY_DN10985_c0_g1~~TRINITY_DN10985_c0_g1_i1.p1  ORF type:complete len:442 (-),score=152.14 TRINITY_DN10985_c0_g1_i1:106-1404(-)
MFRQLCQRVAPRVVPRVTSRSTTGSLPTRSFFTSADDEDVLTREIKKVEEVAKANGLEGKLSPNQLALLRAKDSNVDASLRKIREINESWHYVTQGHQPRPTLTKEPVRVAVSGAAGAIGYATIFRIASGEMLGADQPVILHLLELPNAVDALKGVAMELNDCAFPLLRGIVETDDVNKAFDGVQYALLVGSKPRTKGMERGDLLKENGAIFQKQGKALSDNADVANLKVVVVGNPANTNALIAAHNAPNVDPKNFSAMTRLDHNRGLSQLAGKTGCDINSIEKFAIWGNHSATQYPDVNNAQIGGKWAKEVINNEKWITDSFIPDVQQRGAAIIKARGASSAASAGSSAIDHMRDWSLPEGTRGEWTSMAVHSDGSYGATEGLYFSYPVVCENGNYNIVQNVPVDKFSAQKIEASHKELLAERDSVKAYLK